MRRFVAIVVCAGFVGEAHGDPSQRVFLGLVAQELADVVPRPVDRAAMRLEGRVTRLDLRRGGPRPFARCDVSLMVLEMPGGSLRAILSGRAEVSGGAADSLEERAVRGAIRRALRPLQGHLPLSR